MQGHELIEEIRIKQALKSFNLILKFLNSNPFPSGKRQKGVSTFYSRRSHIDSALNPNKTILDNFNLLRVCDNNSYPAYFIYNKTKYVLKIEKAK